MEGMKAQSLRLLTAAVLAGPAVVLLALATPARAAEEPPAPVAACSADAKKPTTATTCRIVWTGSEFVPTKAAVVSGVGVVFKNNGGAFRAGIGDGTLTVRYQSGETNFDTKPIQVASGASSKPLVLTNKTGKPEEVVTGQDQSVAGTPVLYTITVKAAPKPSPTPSPSTSTPPKPEPTTGSSPKPGTTAAPGTTVLGQGQANVPTLGSGNIFATPGAPNAPLGPLVAGPDFADPNASPAPEANIEPQAGASLAQPVDARRLGLPGALAAVLVAGVLVGVVRLARAEYGLGGTQPPSPPST